MTTRSLVLIGLLCLGTAATVYTPPVEARTFVDVDVDVGVPPPPPRPEPVIVRAGYVWAPGYWRWDPYVHHHVWVPGRYYHERHGYVWVAAGWGQGPHGGWHYHHGYWGRP